MLELQVHDGEKLVTLQFEHSLLSISKWESVHRKPFLSRTGLSPNEQLDYYRCMLLTPGVNPDVVYRFKPEQQEELWHYINTPQTATSPPRDENQKGKGSTSQTSEELYAILTGLEIDWRCETWHVSRMSALIETVSNLKSPPPKKSKMDNMADILRIRKQNQELMQRNNG